MVSEKQEDGRFKVGVEKSERRSVAGTSLAAETDES